MGSIKRYLYYQISNYSMNVDIYRAYIGKPISKKSIKIEYDRSNKNRPAWIYVEGLPRNTFIISTRINNKIILYKTYLTPKLPLFLPVDYTKEEMKTFYDKFSETYDKYIKQNNIAAAGFLLKKLRLQKNVKLLDLGAGTGIGSIPFIRAGYKNITLIEYSPKMLNCAKKKKELKKCRFICKDIRDLNLNEKFNLIFSIFSFGLHAYFSREEMPILWKKIHKHLKPNGTIALIGHEFQVPKSLFKEIKSGKKKIIEGYRADWYIGSKKEINSFSNLFQVIT